MLTNLKAPNGLAVNGNPISEAIITTGKTFYVHSGTGSNINKGESTAFPLATIDAAIGKCTANKGDVIIVMPGHAETIAAAGGITADIAGISIIGLGAGSNRPTISYSATASTFLITAANVRIENIYFNMCDTVNTVVAGLVISGANVVVKNCDVLMSVGSVIALNWITTTVGAMNLKIIDCKGLSPVAGANECIKLVGATDGVEIKNCVIAGDFAVAPIHNPTGNVLTNLLIADCVLKNDQAGDFALELVSACTGALVRNYYHTNALATAVDPGSCFSYECYACHAVDKNGLLTPGVDS